MKMTVEKSFEERQFELHVFVRGTTPYNHLQDARQLAIDADIRIKELKHSIRDLTRTVKHLRGEKNY